MADSDKLDATFYAFKKRDQRFVLTRAAIAYFAVYLLICAIYLALAWSSLGSLFAWYGTVMGEAMQGGEPAAPPPEVLGLVPIGVGIAFLTLILFAAFEAACLRWLVRGESGGVLGLTLGADTWRVFAGYFLWLGLFVVFCILVVLFYALTTTIANIGGAARIAALLLGALAPLGFIALLFWGSVTFAPASAASIARRRFAFFEAPRISLPHFWPLLGSFIILWLGYIVVVWVVGSLIQLPAQAAMAPVVADIMTGNTSDIGARMVGAMSSPIYLASMAAYMLFSAIVATVFYIALFGANARAVLAFDETQPGAPT